MGSLKRPNQTVIQIENLVEHQKAGLTCQAGLEKSEGCPLNGNPRPMLGSEGECGAKQASKLAVRTIFPLLSVEGKLTKRAT